MISRTTTRVSAAHGQCARGRHGRTGIESVIEWWLVQLLMGPDARATHRREREEESVSSNGMEKNVRTERTSRERKEEGARKKGLSPKKSALARARSCCCCTDAQPMDAFFRRSPNHSMAEENRRTERLQSGLAWTRLLLASLFPSRVSNDSSRDFEGVARLAADQPINKITRFRFYPVDAASSLFYSFEYAISVSRF